MTKKKAKALRRGERVRTFPRLGRATGFGMALLMQGATAARGVTFVPIKPARKKKKAKRRARSGV